MLDWPKVGASGAIMARCVAFDKQTAQAISKSLHLLSICDPDSDPLQSALQSHACTTLLALPAESGNRVLMVRMQRTGSAFASGDTTGGDSLTSEAGGFLGLSDRLVYAPEPEAPKKWWQKILD